MDIARCTCRTGITPNVKVRNVQCPIHGDTPIGADPKKPWRLSEKDRELLRSFRIMPEE